MTELSGLVRPGPDDHPLTILLSRIHRADEVGFVEVAIALGSGGPPLRARPVCSLMRVDTRAIECRSGFGPIGVET
jgi:hypothetical protein